MWFCNRYLCGYVHPSYAEAGSVALSNKVPIFYKKCDQFILKWEIHMYIFTCYVGKRSSHRKSTCRLVYVKKKKIVLKIRLFVTHVLSFYVGHKIIWGFRETVRPQIECRDVHKNFFLNFFDN
jgi:hypothetical protein